MSCYLNQRQSCVDCMAHRVCGLDNGYEAKMDTLLCQLTNGKFSKSRDYSLEFMAARIEEEYESLYASADNNREKALESLAESLYADYYDEYPDRAEEVYAERMKDLGLEIDNE